MHARIKSRRVLQRTLKENLLLLLDVCEYAAERELHFASLKLMLVIIIITVIVYVECSIRFHNLQESSE